MENIDDIEIEYSELKERFNQGYYHGDDGELAKATNVILDLCERVQSLEDELLFKELSKE